MEKDVRLESYRERPHWALTLDDKRKIIGWGNPMTDKSYVDFLNDYLDDDEMCVFKDDIQKVRFSMDTPIMIFYEDGKAIVLKPEYIVC